MSEAINAALAILAASLILWAVEPARAEVQDGGKKTTTMEPARLSEPSCALDRALLGPDVRQCWRRGCLNWAP